MRTDLFSQRRMRIARENFYVASYAHRVGDQWSVVGGQSQFELTTGHRPPTRENKKATCLHRSHSDFMKWLGRKDSNLRMPDPKTGALPLGYAPIISETDR